MTNAALPIGIGAGLAAAMLFGVVATGNPLGLLLFFIAPLPILIASLGWNHRAGLIAAVTAAGALALAVAPVTGLAFALSVGLPAWWLGYLALLARVDEAGRAEWYPLGRLLGWIVALSAAVTMAGVLSLGLDYATYVATFERAVGVMMRLNPQLLDRLPTGDRKETLRQIAAMAAVVAPPLSAALNVFTTTFLVWAAARVVRASERLPRPWPAIEATELPKVAAAILGVSLVLATLGGFPGLAARCLAAAALAAFALIGLATIHSLLSGFAARGFALGLLYALILILQGLPLIGAAILGVIETFARRRARHGAGPA